MKKQDILQFQKFETGHHHTFELPIDSSGEIKVHSGDFLDYSPKVTYKGKTHLLNNMSWPHYEFSNRVGTVITKLMRAGRAVNVVEINGRESIVQFKPCKKMANIIKHFDSLKNKDEKNRFRMELMCVSQSKQIPAGFLKKDLKNPLILQVRFRGHHEGGSYTYAKEAAKEYLERLHKKFRNITFTYEDYDSSNADTYTFEFQVKI